MGLPQGGWTSRWLRARPQLHEIAKSKENRLLNQLHDNLAHCLIAARLADAEQRRTGHRVTRARRLSRRADKASVRAQRLSRQAALAQRQVRLAGARTS